MPAGRRQGDGQAFQQVCRFIQTDGVTDEDAALLAGMDGEWLRQWLQDDPGAGRELKAARAVYRRERLIQIRTSEKKGDTEWRPHSYLLENTPASHADEAGKCNDTHELAAGGKVSWSANFIITPHHLRELQLHRQAALARLNPEASTKAE